MSDNERIAVLETEMQSVKITINKDVIPALKRIEAGQAKQAGFIAGATATATFFWALIASGVAAVWHYLTK